MNRQVYSKLSLTLSLTMLLAVCATSALAQTATAGNSAPQAVASTNLKVIENVPKETDMYCSGFISSQPMNAPGTVVGSWDSPNNTLLADRDYVHIVGGGIERDGVYQVLRRTSDPQQYRPFKEQPALLAKVGTVYSEVGRVKVVKIDGSISIAAVMQSCDAIL